VNPYLIYVKMGAAALVLAIAAGAGYHFGGLSSKTALEADHAAMAKAATDALLAQRAHATAQAINDNAAETQHAQTIIQIDSAPPIRTPVFLCAPGDPLRAGTVSSTEGETRAGDPSTAEGRGQPVDRERDIRPGTEALKRQLEIVMADYRRLDAEWAK
jgi:hypothetical protein